MVDPPVSVTLGEVLDGIVGLVRPAPAGRTGLTVLNQLVEAVVPAAGASGGGLALLCPPVRLPQDLELSGRVVVATGSCDWLLGSPVTVTKRTAIAMSVGDFDRTKVAGLSGHADRLCLCQESPQQSSGYLADQIVLAPCVAAGVFAGFLMVRYPLDGPAPTRDQRSIAQFYATLVANCYPSGPLPIHSEITDQMRHHETSGDGNLFIAVTSHQLRTPATVIKGYADTLVEHWDRLAEPEKRSAISAISRRARDLGKLLDRLLVAADGAGDTPATTMAPFDLSEAVRDAIEELPPDLRGSVRSDLRRGLPKALGDQATIGMIVTELVTNACKYSPAGRVEVEVTTVAEQRGVMVRVADRGIGIEAEHTERAFDRFWQSNPGGRRSGAGVGLGLYLVRRIVERQHGWVSLRPRSGGGTVVEVRLPRAGMGPGEA